jgi:hypothetical protein
VLDGDTKFSRGFSGNQLGNRESPERTGEGTLSNSDRRRSPAAGDRRANGRPAAHRVSCSRVFSPRTGESMTGRAVPKGGTPPMKSTVDDGARVLANQPRRTRRGMMRVCAFRVGGSGSAG